MSDTPRTDAEAFWPHDSHYKVCDAVFARQLEGELNAANAIIRQQQLLDEENLRLQERIKRLEEAGDEMHRWCSNPRIVGGDTEAADEWQKAKEAKP